MNDEIKEILEQLEWYRKIGKKDVYYPECVLPNKKAFILLDYITNLQNENQKLKEDKRKAVEYIKNDMPYLQEIDKEYEDMNGDTYFTYKEWDDTVLLNILQLGSENK